MTRYNCAVCKIWHDEEETTVHEGVPYCNLCIEEMQYRWGEKEHEGN